MTTYQRTLHAHNAAWHKRSAIALYAMSLASARFARLHNDMVSCLDELESAASYRMQALTYHKRLIA